MSAPSTPTAAMDIFALDQYGSATRQDGSLLALRFPIRFAWVDTLDQVDILDCIADGPPLVAGGAATHVARPSIHVALAAAEPAALPVTLRVQNEADHSNDLWLAFTLRLPDEAVPRAGDMGVEIPFRLSFQTGVAIAFTAHLTASPIGVRVDRLERRGRRPAIVRNLGLLMVAVMLAEVWALLARDVYGLPAFASPHLISLAVGAAVAFLGVSLLRIRSWFTTLANLSGVLHFPEIHVPRVTADALSTRFASVLLPCVIVLFGAQWGFNGPLEVDRTALREGFRIVDLRRDNAEVHQTQVRVRDVLEGAFGVLCGSNPPLSKPTLLARLGFAGLRATPRPIQYALSFPPHLDIRRSGAVLDHTVTKMVSGLDLPEYDLEQAPHIVPAAVCGEASGRDRIQVVFEADSGSAAEERPFREPKGIVVLDDPPEGWNVLYTHMDRLRERALKAVSADSLWIAREAYIDLLASAIDTLSTRSLSPDTLVRFIRYYWENEVGPPDEPPERGRMIERAIMSRALVRHFERHPHERLERGHIAAVIDIFDTRIGAIVVDSVNFRVYRSAWEVLLDLERIQPDGATAVHAAIVRNLSHEREDAIGAEPALQYLRALIAIGLQQRPGALDVRRAFFARMAGTIVQLAGVSRPDDIVTYLLANDYVIRQKWTAAQLNAPIRDLFPPSLASAPSAGARSGSAAGAAAGS